MQKIRIPRLLQPLDNYRQIRKKHYIVNTMKTLAFLALTLPAVALPNKLERDVVYTEEFAPEGITLKVEKPGWVYQSKKGGRKYGALKVGSKAELVFFTQKAYFVRGKRENGEGVSGWVTPAAFSSTEPDFVEKLKAVHTRQLTVRKLIEDKEIAVGMHPDEVAKVLGRPTKTTVRRTAEGQTQVWEYIEQKIQKHYATIRDPYTGAYYRQYTHSTTEEKSKKVIEFKNGHVSATEFSEQKKRSRPKIITAPIIFSW